MIPALGEPFDGGDLAAFMHDRECQAGVGRVAVDQHGAGAALAVIAALLGAGQVEAFAQGVEQLLIIGSDSPTLAARHFEAAFDALDAGADVVIGPSFDGGYYLIGFRAAHTGVFQDIDWSTREVLGQTLARANQEELDVALLEFWYDVDELEDLLLLRTHLRQHLARMGGGQYSDTRTMLEQLESILD